MRGLLGLIACLAAMSPAFVARGQAENVGVAASVVPDATGTPPRGQMRTLAVGADMVHNERVATGPIGRTQMLFLDGSALTVGPNSDVTLDEFVYDPSTETGKLALSASRGVLRLVGGKISKTDPVTLKTPTATIGIRGGIGIWDNGTITFLFGRDMTIDAPQPDGSTQRVQLVRPGTVTVAPGGQIGPVTPVTSQAIAGTLGALEGSRGSSGGASEQPTENRVAATQVAALGSTNVPTSIAPVSAAAAPPPTTVVERAGRVAELRQASQSDDSSGQGPGQSRTNRLFTGVSLFNPVFQGFDFSDASAMHVPGNFDRGAFGFAAGNIFFGFGGGGFAALPFLSGFFSIDPASTFSSGGRLSGDGFVNDTRDFFFYRLRAVENGNNPVFLFGGKINPNPITLRTQTAFSAWKLVPGFPGDNQIPLLPAAFGGNLGGATVSPLLAVLRPNTPETSVDGAISATLFGALAVDGSGAQQRSALVIRTGSFFVDQNPNNPTFGQLSLGGAAAGSVRLSATDRPIRIQDGSTPIFDQNGASFYGAPGAQPSFVLGSDLYTAGAGFPYQDSAAFAQPFTNLSQPNAYYAAHPALPAPNLLPTDIGASRSTRTLNGYVAGLGEQVTGTNLDYVLGSSTTDPTDVSISTDAARNRMAAVFRFQGSGTQQFNLVFGDLQSGNGSRSAFIDDRRFGARQSADTPSQVGGNNAALANLAMISYDVVPNTSFFDPGTGPCQCQYAVWGFFNFDAQGTTGPRTRGHLVPWVAGELPAIGTLPISGTASYQGHAVGDVFNNGARYIAGGNYTQTWDFASKTGQGTISNFDGRTFSTSGNLSSLNGRDFSGVVLGCCNAQGGPIAGGLNGSFVRGGGDPAAELIGQFQISGGTYMAGGIIAARK